MTIAAPNSAMCDSDSYSFIFRRVIMGVKRVRRNVIFIYINIYKYKTYTYNFAHNDKERKIKL